MADISSIVSTLLTNGFHIKQVHRFAHENLIVQTYKYDKLGAKISYGVLFTNDETETPIIQTLITLSQSDNSTPVIVSDKLESSICLKYTSDKFFSFFGGIVNSGLILIPNLDAILQELGHNKLPVSLEGEPNDLLELYVAECLQFLLESPTRRYGRDRAFESVPDGIVLGKNRFVVQFDAKAYSKGYSFTADDIKRFSSYVNDFNLRYQSYFGMINYFIVVSGKFNDSLSSINSRSSELYNNCNCKLTCIEAKELGEMATLLKSTPEIRGSILWKNIFSETMVNLKKVREEINRVLRDKLH